MTENLLADDGLPTADPNKKYLEELVGENKKFKTHEDLARGKYEADSYIELLKRQKDELRDDYLKLREEAMAKAKLEDLVNQLQNKQQQSPNSEEPQRTEKTPTIDPKQIEDLLNEKLRNYEVTKKQQENLKLVKDRLTERFGTSYQNNVKQHIQDLDMSEEEFNQMAQNNPKLLFKTLDLDQKPEPFPTLPRTTTRSDNFSPNRQTKKTWAYYQEMKKANPKMYYDPKITNEMQQSYQQLGSDFEDGDFRQYGDGA